MPPPLPDRFSLEVRLGRDQDVEEWLATDTALDRPVLIRILGPETSQDRRQAFVDDTRSGAAITHVHLVSVYAAGLIEEGAYSVTEWAGGVSMADRLAAGETIPVDEFLPNAAGLAEGLAAFHKAGGIHGAIDAGAIYFSGSHPAKLGSFGRPHSGATVSEDTRALAETLETCITGRAPGTAFPSQVVDGIPTAVDEALDAARRGTLDAAGLAQALHTTTQTPTTKPREPKWSWRWLAPATLLSFLAVGIVAIGLVLPSGPGSPILFPATPDATTTTNTVAPTSTVAITIEGGSPLVVRAFSYDPEGDGSEHDENIPKVIDSDPATSWRTERYFDPIPQLKRGVGVVFELNGQPGEFVATGLSDATAYTLMWAAELPTNGIDGWERLASGTVSGEQIRAQIPERDNGFWLLWFTDLPPQEDGFYASLAEVRFLP
ncbi:MAG: protein kinase [Acidimicrobiia bacterium]